MATLLNQLTLARLLIYDPDLQHVLDDLAACYWDIAKTVERIVSPSAAPMAVTKREAEPLYANLQAFDVARQELYTQALNRLKPTVVETRRRRKWATRLFQ